MYKHKTRIKLEEKGITLIVLVITIIILLIIAGVTSALLTGENGILNKATKASKETDKQTATEIMNLKITNIQIATYTEKQKMPTLQEFADNLCDDNEIEYVITKDKEMASRLPHVDTTGHTSIFTKLNDYPYEFEIDGKLKLATIDGNVVDDNIGNDNANTNNNEELMTKLEEMEVAIKSMQTENTNMKTQIQTLTTNNQELKNQVEELDAKALKYLDYAKNKDITFTNKSYTVENDGYIQLMFQYTAGIDESVNDNLFINGTNVFFNSFGVRWQNAKTPMFPVRKGDVITYNSTAQSVTGKYFPNI